jgi:hypothetical protein
MSTAGVQPLLRQPAKKSISQTEEEMKISKVLFLGFFCLVAITPIVWSRSQAQPIPAVTAGSAHGIPGYLDPKTGTFTSRAQIASPDVQAAGTTRILFRLIFPITIDINDQSSGNTTACSVDISTSDAAGFVEDSGSTVGNANGCTVTILAQWDLATPVTDKVSISFEIASSGSGGTRSTSHSIAQIAMPGNTQTITEPVIDVVL